VAQSGFTPIQLYYSTTASNVPSASNLALGELAINIADGKLYYNSSGTIKLIAANLLPIANGGTFSTTIPTAGAIAYGDGLAYQFTGVGTTGQLLTSAGAGVPTWSNIASIAVTSLSFGTTGLTPATATQGAITVAGTLAVANGGTGLTSTPANGALDIGNGTGFTRTTLTAGSGVSITNTAGSILISATGTGGTVTSVTGTSPVNVATGTTTPVISLASGYGDTQNPYASKTANYVLAAPNGLAGVPAFRALVAADVPGSALTKTDDTNVTLTLGGSPTTALLNAASLTLGWSGQLSVGRGGTGLSAGTSGGIPYFSSTSAMTSSALLTQYGVIYGGGAGASPVATAAGTTGQILTATTGGAPTWSSTYAGTVTSVSFTGGIITVATATTTPALTVAGTSGGIPYFSSGTTWASSAALTQYGVVYGGGAGAAPVSTAAGTTGQVLTATTGGAPTWAAPATSGTVTSVGQSFTGGLISVAGSPVTSSGTLALTVAGTSGGIPYFSSATTWATSAALAANAIVLGGGAGAAPATTTTGTGVVTALGINTGTAGAFVVNGGALGTPSSGTVTNLTGTASININGTVGATTPDTGAFTTLSATGVTTVQAGTAALPAITTTGDTDTGIFFPAANTIAFTTNGVNTARFSSGFFGINNSSPATYLDIVGAVGTVTSPTFLNQTVAVLRNNFHTRMAFVNPSNTYSGDISRYNSSAAFPTNTISLNGSSGFVFTSGDGTVATTEKMRIDQSGNVLVTNATGGLGYGTGSGGTVTQGTIRATAVTLNKFTGAITMFTAAGSLTWSQFTVNNSLVAATDTITINQKSGAVNYYVYQILAVTAGSFNIGFASVSGVASDAPVLSFTIIKGVTA